MCDICTRYLAELRSDPPRDTLHEWIGCDLDGTLAVADDTYSPEHVGVPVPKMVERVKQALAEGKDVRIFTARVADKSGDDLAAIEKPIQEFCLVNLGRVLPITCQKDAGMVELWDDRARRVEKNTGEFVRAFSDNLPKKVVGSEVASGADRNVSDSVAVDGETVKPEDAQPEAERENLMELFATDREKPVALPEEGYKKLYIGYGPLGGQQFPEAAAMEMMFGPQNEPLVFYREPGGVKRCVACECGGCEEHRYSEDQPRDSHGRFGRNPWR